MSHTRKISIPADNPEYFNCSRWVDHCQYSSVTPAPVMVNHCQYSSVTPAPVMTMRPPLAATVVTSSDTMVVEPPPVHVLESIRSIDKMAEKEAKPRSKKGLGSLKRLFRSASRRGSASEIEVDHSNNNSSLPPAHHTNHYASLPSSPRHESKSQANRLPSNNEDTGSRLLNNNKPPSGSGHNISLRSRSQSSGARQDSLTASSWPGMVPPWVPSLHSSCRGFSVKDLPDIVILFSGECNTSRRWREYLGKELVTEDRKVGGQRLEEFGEMSSLKGEEGLGRRCEETVYHCPLVILLLSKKMMTWLEKTRIVLGKLLHPDRVIGVYVDMSHDQVTPAAANGLQTLPCWRSVLIGQDSDQDRSDFLIGQYTKEILTNQKRLSETPAQAKYQLFPRKLSLTQTKLMIILEEGIDAIDREQLAVDITYPSDLCFTLETAKWIKDDIVQLELPPVLFHTSSIVTLTLRVGDTNYGQRPVKLDNVATMLEQCWSHCQDTVTMFSQAFNARFQTVQDIDEYLSASWERRLHLSDLVTGAGSDAGHVDTLLSDLTNQRAPFDPAANQRKGDHGTDTLLHWAATHGLTKLCVTLLASGHARYLDTINNLELTPVACAHNNGHGQLATLLRSHMLAIPNGGHMSAIPNNAGKMATDSDGYLIPQIVHAHSLPRMNEPIRRQQYENGPIRRQQYENGPIRVESSKDRNQPRNSSDHLYKIPPTPVPLPHSYANISPSVTSSPPRSSSSSCKQRTSSGPSDMSSPSRPQGGYIRMEATNKPLLIKKAMSEPRSDDCFHPKSGSFSHFTNQGSNNNVQSREELIAKYCPDSRPGSVTPVHDNSVTSCGNDNSPHLSNDDNTPPSHLSSNIYIPHSNDDGSESTNSSPLDHYVHTDPHLDGIVYLPIVDSPDPNDQEVSQFFKDSDSNKPQMERSKSLRARMSPSRSKLFRSMRRRSGGSVTNDDNDIIDPIAEDAESDIIKQEPVHKESLLPARSNSLGHRRNLNPSFLYDVPRKVTVTKSESPFTKVMQSQSSGVKNSNIGAYENVIL